MTREKILERALFDLLTALGETTTEIYTLGSVAFTSAPSLDLARPLILQQPVLLALSKLAEKARNIAHSVPAA